MAKKYCYLFTEGNAQMREILGGKGANLAEMTNIGLPVPQGFTISTEACTQYYEDGKQINPSIQKEILEYIDKMERITGKKFGDEENPLLVSVRSGARASMPGMMDTILNLGLNETVVNTILEYQDGVSFFGTSTNWEEKVEMGEGRSFGLELMAQKTLGKTTGWLAYTLSKTDHRFKSGTINQGRWFPYKYDRRHSISLNLSHNSVTALMQELPGYSIPVDVSLSPKRQQSSSGPMALLRKPVTSPGVTITAFPPAIV